MLVKQLLVFALGCTCVLSTGYGNTQSCQELVLGAALSLTGKYAGEGELARDGYEFATKKINNAGGVTVGGRCYTLRVAYYDDESKGDRSALLAERLINQDGVRFMLGPYSSGLTMAVTTVAEKYRIPLVEAAGASRALFNKGYRYLFAVLNTAEDYMSSAIDLASEMARVSGKSVTDVRVAIAVENDPFSLDVRSGALEDIREHGMQVVIDEQLPRDLSDMSSILTKVKLLQPDILIVSGHAKGAATAVKQIAEHNLKVPMVVTNSCESADIIGKYGKAAEGILCSTQWAETISGSDPLFGSAPDYSQAFKIAFPKYANRAVSGSSAGASAAVYVYKDAFERAGSLDPESVREALAATDLDTFYGRIRFAKDGHNLAKTMILRQVQDGAYNVVAPGEAATHKLRWPRN